MYGSATSTKTVNAIISTPNPFFHMVERGNESNTYTRTKTETRGRERRKVSRKTHRQKDDNRLHKGEASMEPGV